MNIEIKDIVKAIENYAPLYYQESYDNSGVQVGNIHQKITGVLLTLDITSDVVKEAIALGYNCIVAHHPLIFSGIKSITGKNDIEQCILLAIKNDIVLYAAHTNLDNVLNGVNDILAAKLNLINKRILSPSKQHHLVKFECYVPTTHIEEVKSAIFAAGGGNIGNYSECSFASNGIGTYKPMENANPKVGEQLVRSEVEELKIEVLVPEYLSGNILNAVRNVGFYEEVAYNIVPLRNNNQYIGAGMIGELEKPLDEQSFLKYIKEQLNLNVIKYTPLKHTNAIKSVAVCGGSGSFLLAAAKANKADVLITADYKYHQFFEAESKIMIADIGHYESERYTNVIFEKIIKTLNPNIKVQSTSINTNPIAYFKG